MISETSKITPNLSFLGKNTPICPYCDTILSKMPGRKISCPICKPPIYVRTRAIDRKKILIQESDIGLVEKDWQAARAADRVNSGPLQDALSWIKMNKSHPELKTTNEIIYYSIQEIAKTALNDKQMMKFSGCLTAMGDIMRAEHKDRDAMILYMDVLYLEVNGGWDCHSSLQGSQPFRESDRVSIPVGLVGYLHDLQKYLTMSDEEMFSIFISESKNIKELCGLNGKYSEGIDAWGIIHNEFKKYIDYINRT